MFSKRLKEAIDKKGVSRYQISKDTQITEATLSNYCNGKSNPSPLFVKLLAEYLDVDYNWLLTGEEVVIDKSPHRVEEPRTKYRARKKNFSKSDLSSIVLYFEDQMKHKDKFIKHQEDEFLKRIATIEDKIDVLIKEVQKLKNKGNI